MADVVITMKIMPESPDVDLVQLKEKVLQKIIAFTEMENYKTSEESLAFGLKAIVIMFVMFEGKGTTDSLEADIETIEGVGSVEVTDVRRTIG